MRQKLFLEIFLCLFTLVVCTFLVIRSKIRVLPAGAFGNDAAFNETLGDFATTLYGEIFYE